MAASYGADSVVKFLMERGADVTIRDTSLRSMLHAAVGDVKSMEALLQVKVVTVIMMIEGVFMKLCRGSRIGLTDGSGKELYPRIFQK